MTWVIDLVCPGCRTLAEGRLDLRTLERRGDVLACACGRRYPVIDGVPLVMADPTGYLRSEIACVVERDLAPDVAALLVATGPDDAPYPRMLEHLSIYLDAHWGDRADPPPDGPGSGFALAALVERLAALPHVPLAVELGSSVGRIVAELARRADQVAAVELHFGAQRRARHLLAGDTVAYARRRLGRTYTSATARGSATPNATLVCGDALDPPLVPGVFDRVVAINLVDSVARPRQLLAVLDQLCKPGGELVLASPYSWQSAVMDDAERLGDGELAAWLAGRYRILDEADLPWHLRRDARSAATYSIHYVRAGKIGRPESVQ